MSLTRWRDTGSDFSFGEYRIFTRAAGEGDEALLLLHGFPTASWDFEALWPRLAKRFGRIVTLDWLGLGFSDKPQRHRYSIAEQADLARAVLEAHGVRRVHLLAHDYGACVAQELLARQRDRVQGPQMLSAVLMNAPLFYEVEQRWWPHRLLLSPIGPLYVRMVGERRFWRAFSALFGADTKPGPIELHDYWTLVDGSGGRAALRAVLRYAHERREQRERWRDALLLDAPPLRLIIGADDPVSGRRVAAHYQQLRPDADVALLDGIGHFPHVEAPDRVARAVLAFHDALARRG
ncbi:alpha/beta fold hydrolase [Solimonas marina]|uniref:Alpha/beta hydrolase n=1 Tax=Solimonas marina TaxID=2714601 RepID=A0A970B4V4_9GAMM|nr:alpha/beta hydrolase [Solimonas marina]NKF22717.1 alpha/beta hydrolase [Solimonas marina]